MPKERIAGNAYELPKSKFTHLHRVYNGFVPESLKVPKDKFEAAIRALLNTPPMPAGDIPRKREPKEKQAKKRG